MTAFSRTDTPEKERRQFNLYVDELQRFQSANFATFISEARKFNIATCLSHQVLSQLTEQNRASALASGNLIVFRVSGDDSRVLSKSFDTTPTRIINGEEAVRAPVADVISHLVTRGHNDPRVARFAQSYLSALEKYAHTKLEERMGAYYECFFNRLVFSDSQVQRGRTLLNQTLYTAMVEGYDAARLYTLSVYVLATAKQEGFEYLLSPYIKSTCTEFLGPHELVEFTQDANKFAKASFITPENAQRYISAVPRKYEWMGQALVTMLTELRYTMQVLSQTPVMVDTGQTKPRYQMQTHADREAEISKEITLQQNFTARVKLVNGGEYTIRTKPAPETLTGNALTERIEAVKRHMRTLGYTRHYTEVIEELRKRQEYLLGMEDIPDEDAADNGYDMDEPPPGSFTLD